MLDIEIKPSLRVVQLLARIERFCGGWSRFSNNALLTSDEQQIAATVRAIAALCELEEAVPSQSRYFARELRLNSTPPTSLSELLVATRGQPLLANIVHALSLRCSFERADISYINAMVLSGGQSPAMLRNNTTRFRTANGEMVFPTTAAFLVESRFEEILAWSSDALENGEIHPLLVLGVTHLLLLQLAPFADYSHATVLLLLGQQLIAHGYEFARYAHPAEAFAQEADSYYNSLRLAEKTAGESWASLCGWLEFYLAALLRSCASLEQQSETAGKYSRLSAIQQDILEVVRSNGSATRDLIVTRTGINTSTVKYNLTLLASIGVLKRNGGGRTTSYTVL